MVIVPHVSCFINVAAQLVEGRTIHKRGRSIDSLGSDAAKKIRGKKRNILFDTEGLLMHVLVRLAGLYNCDGGVWVTATLFGLYLYLFLFKLCAGF